MRRTRYAPYPVVNVIFDKPVYNRGYDTWCPGNTFTDFIVADWNRGRDQARLQTKKTTFSRSTLRSVNTSAPPLLPGRKLQVPRRQCPRRLPESLGRSSTSTPSRSASIAAAIPCSWPPPGQFTKNRLVAAQPMDRNLFRQRRFQWPGITHQRIRTPYPA